MKTLLITFLMAIFVSAFAQPQGEILLWPELSSDKNPEKVRITETGEHVISNIHSPSITPYLPALQKATHAAVIIAPGGGHRELWIDHEGYNPARWFSERGIAVFVLKYRLSKDINSVYDLQKHSLADISRAIRLVRVRAKEWNIDTTKIGVMGSSAGGELAAMAAMYFDKGNPQAKDPIDRESCRPAFQGLIYPGGSDKFKVLKNSPPIFLLGGYNDRDDIALGIARVYAQYKEAGIQAELHVYANTGHGFGIRSGNTAAVAGWPERFLEWLASIKIIQP